MLVLWCVACRGSWSDIRARLPAVIGLTACCSLLISVHVYRQDLTFLALVCGVVQAKQAGSSLRFWFAAAALVWLAQYLGPDLLLNHGINVQTPALVLVTMALARQALSTTNAEALAPPAASGDVLGLAA